MSDLFPLGSQDFGRLGRLRDPYANLQIDDLDDTSPPEGGEQPFYVGTAVGAPRLRLVFGVVAALLLVAVTAAANLQLRQGAAYASISEGNRTRLEALPTERGVIYDRAGVPLVRNTSSFSAVLNPVDLPKEISARQAVIGRLASILDVAPLDIERRLWDYDVRRSDRVVVAENLTHEQAVRLEVESSDLPALSLATELRREYLGTGETPSLSHLLGYVGRVSQEDLSANKEYLNTDSVGKTGLEKRYEGVLRGRYGESRVEVDATGRLKKEIASDPGIPGRDLRLTVDYALQRDVEKLLADGIKASGAKRGAAIVMDPRTGDLLALVGLPAYDANLFSGGIGAEDYRKLAEDKDRPLFERAFKGTLPSGSTFKPVVAAAALAEGLISANTTVMSTGGLRYGRWLFPDWKAGGHGATNVAKAIAESVNTFFYVIGGGNDLYPNIKPLGPDLIAAYARKFGFGEPTGIDLPGEASGLVPTPQWKKETRSEQWYIGDTYHVAIGQGDVMVTPLQIARMTAVFANGGQLVDPRLVRGTGGEGGGETFKPVVDNPQVVSADVVETVRRGMRQTVTSGSARSFASLPWAIAAKTGTAQWNSKKPNHAWFTSFGPYDDPEIVVTVIIEEGGEGSSSAAPVARAIYQRYFTGKLWTVQPTQSAAAAAAEEEPPVETAAPVADGTPQPEGTPVQPPTPPPAVDDFGGAAP